MADGPQRLAAELAHALGERVGHRVELVAVLVQQQVVIAKVRAAHVPVEILRLEVQGEHVGQDAVQRAGDVGRGARREVGRGGERGLPAPAFRRTAFG